MYLPNELINSILSFRPPHPTAVLLKQSIIESNNQRWIDMLCKDSISWSLFFLSQRKIELLNKKMLKINMEYMDYHDRMRKKMESFFLNGIHTRTAEDELIFIEYQDKINFNTTHMSYIYDKIWSLFCCGMINEEYFHRKQCKDFYSLYENEYSTIYNKHNTYTKRNSPRTDKLYMRHACEESLVDLLELKRQQLIIV